LEKEKTFPFALKATGGAFHSRAAERTKGGKSDNVIKRRPLANKKEIDGRGGETLRKMASEGA